MVRCNKTNHSNGDIPLCMDYPDVPLEQQFHFKWKQNVLLKCYCDITDYFSQQSATWGWLQGIDMWSTVQSAKYQCYTTVSYLSIENVSVFYWEMHVVRQQVHSLCVRHSTVFNPPTFENLYSNYQQYNLLYPLIAIYFFKYHIKQWKKQKTTVHHVLKNTSSDCWSLLL